MTRTLTLRVPDEQYDWLIERVQDFEGDLSAAARDAIDAGRILYGILGTPDPEAALRLLLEKSEREAAREAYFDEFGEYPPE